MEKLKLTEAVYVALGHVSSKHAASVGNHVLIAVSQKGGLLSRLPLLMLLGIAVVESRVV